MVIKGQYLSLRDNHGYKGTNFMVEGGPWL
jgi:hypothetical protein